MRAITTIIILAVATACVDTDAETAALDPIPATADSFQAMESGDSEVRGKDLYPLCMYLYHVVTQLRKDHAEMQRRLDDDERVIAAQKAELQRLNARVVATERRTQAINDRLEDLRREFIGFRNDQMQVHGLIDNRLRRLESLMH